MFWDLILGLMVSFAPNVSDAWTSHAAKTIYPAPVVDSMTVEAFSPQRTDFHVAFGDQQVSYKVMAMFVLPSETVPVSVQGEAGAFRLTASGGSAQQAGVNRWTWTAPARAGVYPMEVASRRGETVTLNVFVMVPNSLVRGGYLNGYRIGTYPAARTGLESNYAPPAGFVEVTPEIENVPVSPHFTLGQFVCKQPGSPRYLVLKTDLLEKLETILATLNERGVEAYTFGILSAYRTPFYNAAIGNETSFSRHHYGDAADIFVDNDHDGRMDDINRDGRHSLADARVLQRIADEISRSDHHLLGGLGAYEPTGSHGAFVHVDVRGFEAKWGA